LFYQTLIDFIFISVFGEELEISTLEKGLKEPQGTLNKSKTATYKPKLRQMFPKMVSQYGFLEAPFIRQADGELKKSHHIFLTIIVKSAESLI
jgi:hypothetical protein